MVNPHETINLALLYAPNVGEIVMCEFPNCFQPPEMVKTRPVVVIGPRLRGREDMVALIPLSTTPPDDVMPYHCQIPARLLQPSFQARVEFCLAKCDMVYTLSTRRLSMVEGKRNPMTKKREYQRACLDLEHIRMVRRSLAHSLGITEQLFQEQ